MLTMNGWLQLLRINQASMIMSFLMPMMTGWLQLVKLKYRIWTCTTNEVVIIIALIIIKSFFCLDSRCQAFFTLREAEDESRLRPGTCLFSKAV